MFKHEDFQFGYEIALGSAYRAYADAGEVLSTAGRVKDGDADAWVREWCGTPSGWRPTPRRRRTPDGSSAPAAPISARPTTTRPGCT
jgi:hypothetical protein